MRLLLDTHVALWAVTDDARLSRRAVALIEDPGNSVSVSAATIWEVAIKHGLRRSGAADYVVSADLAMKALSESGYNLLPITPVEAAAVGSLPPHHPDPFARLIVAQALAGPYRLITHDRALGLYSDTVILV